MRYILDARTVNDHFPGIGRYVFNLARAIAPLLNKDEQLILLCHPAQPSPWNLAVLVGERVQLVDIPLSPFSFQQQWIIPSLLHRLGADLYHSPYYLMPYRPGVPTVLTVYDLIPLRYPHYFSIRTRLLFRWTMTLALYMATRVITISQATRRDLLAMYRLPTAKVTSILLAAASVFRPQAPETIAALRTRLNLPEQYVLYLGTNKPHKNLSRLIEAWGSINRKPTGQLWQMANGKSQFAICNLKFATCNLVIAGVWDARYPQVKIRAAELGLNDSVQFLGPVSEADLPALYSGALAFIFPSEYEGFGLPVLEAMSCGVPVACANTSSLPEVAGDAALMFDPVNVDSIAETLVQLLVVPDLRSDLRERSLRWVAQFSWERAALETLTLYRQTLRNE